ncbi:HTTM domain-containing protein [Kitasatospora sp. NPDC058965]|uniref:HTTM domain-containing protein n=1 Tax=Kitasatospora sp. NPDC058965 TaxID=3346682 RepID=UPI00369C587B
MTGSAPGPQASARTGEGLLPAIPQQGGPLPAELDDPVGPAGAAGPAPAPPAARPRAGDLLARALEAFTGRPLARYQAAAVRIGFALVVTLQLLREWPERRVLYGDRAAWSLSLADRMTAQNHAFSALLWHDGRWWFEACYAVSLLAAVLMLLGWRTRFSSVLFLLGVLSVQNRSILVGDGGDNLIHLMAIYLAFTRCAEVWSLDARRRSRGRPDGPLSGVLLWLGSAAALTAAQLTGHLAWSAPDWPHLGWAALLWTLWAVAGLWYAVTRWRPRSEARAVLDALGSMVHHCAMVVIGAQVVLVYTTAGLYKVQGSRWQDGTALYYPLHLDYFTPWPGLSALLGSSMLVVFALSYGTVLAQLAFPVVLWSRRAKNVLLVMMVLEHLGIAVLLGLPIFSLAMVAADAVFLPTAFLVRLGVLARGRRPAAA